jgi:hypothetical protein
VPARLSKRTVDFSNCDGPQLPSSPYMRVETEAAVDLYVGHFVAQLFAGSIKLVSKCRSCGLSNDQRPTKAILPGTIRGD